MVEGKKLFLTYYPDEKEIEFFFGGETKIYRITDYSEIYPGKFMFSVRDLFNSEETEFLEEYSNLNVTDLDGLLKSLLNQTEKALGLLLGKSVAVKEVVYEEERDDE